MLGGGYDACAKPPRDPNLGRLQSFRCEISGVWNGFIVSLRDRTVCVQLAGDTEEDFEDVILALREAFKAHRAQRTEGASG